MELPGPRDHELAPALDAIASPTRLAILRALRTPRALREVDVGVLVEGQPRPLARQTVREHLDKLIEAGLVVARETVREQRATMEFVVNHQSLFTLSEEVRAVARLRPAVEPASPTIAAGGAPSADAVPRPSLVLVRGLDEGAAFDLRPGERSSWTIGRRRGVEVTLDFDRAISQENARITWDGRAHLLEDHPESLNGTTLNFRQLERGRKAALRNGDLIGVGRSLLLYWA